MSIDDVARDVARALRDPALSAMESTGIACLLVAERCSYAQALTALARLREQQPGWETRLPHDMLLNLLTRFSGRSNRSERPPVVVLPSPFPDDGPLTNVVDFWFKVRDNAFLHDGELRGWVLREGQVREQARLDRATRLRRAVNGRPVQNDNDPDVAESPNWSRNMQKGWVRRAAERRAGGAP